MASMLVGETMPDDSAWNEFAFPMGQQQALAEAPLTATPSNAALVDTHLRPPHALAMPAPEENSSYLLMKRLMDLVGAGLVLLFLAPLFAIVALLIKVDSPGPVFYRQERIGRGCRPFTMYKFRSMRVDADRQLQRLLALNEADGPLFKMRADPRVTRVGKVLRRLSVDELPQLINIVLGEMSLVGPRPPLRREVERYDAWQYERLIVTPGVTGLWQVSGRSDLPFEEGVALDIHYVHHRAFWLDLSILLRTIPAVLRCRGAY